MFTKMLDVIDAINEKAGRGISFLIYPGLLILVIEVILRYVFGCPTVWAHGYSQRIFAVYFILIGAYTLLHKGHVRMDLVYSRLSLRGRLVMDLLGTVLLGTWCVVLLWKGSLFFWASFTIREVDEAVLGAPVYPVKFFIPVGVFFLALQWLGNLSRTIAAVRKGER
ncbi:MAG: TRAP transporter small permease subunit [Dehalococcoidia bacterium]|nr:TRAP transporter small permease subunit [Dehalococcoidia bacterium]